MNKKLSIILIILLTILVFTLIGGLFMLLKTDFASVFSCVVECTSWRSCENSTNKYL